MSELKIEYQRGKRGTSGVAMAKLAEKVLHANRLDVFDEAARHAFAAVVVRECPGVDSAAIEAELLQLAGDASDDKGGPNQATVLVDLAKDAELFHAPGADAETYATVPVGNHRETHRIGSKAFRQWLCGRFWGMLNKAPGSQGLQDALNVLSSKAMYEGGEHPVAIRLAHYGDTIYLDLADAGWHAVEITARGWRVVDNCPVKFVRARGMEALPIPILGGRVDELREFINVRDDDWPLLASFPIAALRPTGPYPLLELNGEHGSAKSTGCRILRATIDPVKALLRAEPRECRDLMIAASNGWIIAMDNLSRVPPWLSDALCRLSTGGGFSTRELYSDADEKIFEAMRPVMMNGIPELATRPDLLDRAVRMTLPTISEHKRRSEGELWAAFYDARPRILGALLDAVGIAMKNLSDVKLDKLPRMADFAIWITAAEPAMGCKLGAFMGAYDDSHEEAIQMAIESSVIGPVILGWMGSRTLWQGTTGELLKDLETYADDKTRKHRDWPGTVPLLRGALRRLANDLRRVDIAITFPDNKNRKGKDRKRLLTIERTGKQPAASSALGADGPDDDENADAVNDGRTVADEADAKIPARSKSSPQVPDGWEPLAWKTELLRRAEQCEAVNPEKSAEYRRQAAAIYDTRH